MRRTSTKSAELPLSDVIIFRGHAKHACLQFTFFDTEALVGTVFETIEFSPDWEDPECQWYPHAPVKSKHDEK